MWTQWAYKCCNKRHVCTHNVNVVDIQLLLSLTGYTPLNKVLPLQHLIAICVLFHKNNYDY